MAFLCQGCAFQLSAANRVQLHTLTEQGTSMGCAEARQAVLLPQLLPKAAEEWEHCPGPAPSPLLYPA